MRSGGGIEVQGEMSRETVIVLLCSHDDACVAVTPAERAAIACASRRFRIMVPSSTAPVVISLSGQQGYMFLSTATGKLNNGFVADWKEGLGWVVTEEHDYE